MWRSNLFYKFFKSKNNDHNKIVKYNSYRFSNIQDEIKTKIFEVDTKISEISKSLFEAQIVKFRSTFSKSNNLIGHIGKNLYQGKLEESIDWHQERLKILYLERKELQTKLEKIQGIFWINSLKRILAIMLSCLLLICGLFIFISGFMIMIYLLPLITLIFIEYWIMNKKS